MFRRVRKKLHGLRAEAVSVRKAVAAVWFLIAKRARLALVGATLLMSGGAWLNAQIPVAVGSLANAISGAINGGRRWTFADTAPFLLTLTVLFLVREALNVARKYLVHNTGTTVEKQITVSLVSHLLELELGMLARDRVGALHGRVRRSVEGFVRLLMLSFMEFVPAVLTAAFALGVAFRRHPGIGALMLGVVPTTILIVLMQIGSQKGIRLALLRSKEEVDGAVVEQLGGIEYVRAADTQAVEAERVERVCEGLRATELRHHFEMSLFDCAKALNEGAFFIAVTALSIALAGSGRIPVGDVVVYAMLFASVLAPLRDVHRILDEAHESTLRVRDLLDLLGQPRDRSFVVDRPLQPIVDRSVPVFELKDVTADFIAPDGSRRTALRAVSVRIGLGEMVGIAGRSGAGKSTLLRIALRLAHPIGGAVHFGGVPLESVTRHALAESIGYVSQSPFLFAGTVRENLSYERKGAPFQDVIEAAKRAGIHDEILAMPGGYDAYVAERGQNLSGGQRQRIALARVFLKDPPVIILDEATSALDTIAERQIQVALDRIRRDRCILVVAHRLSSLRPADRILVFDDGKLAQVGNFAALSGEEGIFASLVASAVEQHAPERAQTVGTARGLGSGKTHGAEGLA